MDFSRKNNDAGRRLIHEGRRDVVVLAEPLTWAGKEGWVYFEIDLVTLLFETNSFRVRNREGPGPTPASTALLLQLLRRKWDLVDLSTIY